MFFDHEVRCDQDRRPTRPPGAAPRRRERLVSQRTSIINQIRAFMRERGIAARQGLRFLQTELPGSDVLSSRFPRR
jgi:transposase